MATEIEILSGPARSGKTAQLLEWYREALIAGQRSQTPGRTLWLSPTQRVADQVRSQLTGPKLPVILAPQVFTFEGFAEHLLEYSSTVMRPLPRVMQRVLVRQIIANQLAAGKIQHFAGIARTSGFLDVVLQLISELKREETWPEDFVEACRKRGARRSDQEVAAIYQEYQSVLLQHQRYDSEGRFWSARDRLENGEWSPFGTFDLVVADAFSDFTHTQYEILLLLSRRASRMAISLPREEPLVRSDLFAQPETALRRLKRLTACQIRPFTGQTATPQTPNSGSGSLDASLTQVSTQLFSNPRERVAIKSAAGFEVLAVTGLTGEVRAVAERVKRLLVDKVPAKDIVVAFRPIGDYAPLVREIFQNSGIPFHCDAQEPLHQQPTIKALWAVLQLELEDWPFERLLAVLNSGWFRPPWAEWDAEWTPRMVSKTLRNAKIPFGRSIILTTLRKAALRGSTIDTLMVGTDEDSDRDSEALNPERDEASLVARAAVCLDKLSDLLVPIRQKTDARTWAECLTKLARELGIAGNEELHDGVSAKSAWQAFEDLVFLAAGTEELLGTSRQRVELHEFAVGLNDLLRQESLSQTAAPEGAVRVLDAAQVRGLEVPYLFLGGLTEGSFPARGGEGFLYTEADREELNEHGLTLSQRAAQTQAEMLLFYSIITRARKRLVFSYPAVSLDGQPLSPSPYLTAVCDLFEPGAVPTTRLDQLDPVPAIDAILSPSDLRLVATSEALQRRTQLFQTLQAQPRGWKTVASILAAIEMSIQRFQTHGFTGYEGIISQTANLKFLAEKYSPRLEYSATQLERYAQCPFRFFMSDVLHIQEVQAPDRFTDHGRRGDIVHEILAELHTQVEPGPEAVPIEAAATLFRKLLEERLTRELAGTELLQALLRVERRLLEEWGDEYAEQWSQYHQQTIKNAGTALQPKLLEVSFGRPHAAAVQPDAESHACLTLGHGEEETRIRGRIDRIDVGQREGQPVFNVIDYKTGRKPSSTATQVKSGRSLQLVLYALAVQRLNLVGDNAFPIQAGYWCLKETGWSPLTKPPQASPQGLVAHADWSALVDVLDELVPRLAAGIRAGRFPVYNTDSECTSYCPYKTTCRVTQIRPLEEILDKTWQP